MSVASLDIDGDQLVLTLTTREKIFALHADMRIPLSMVEAIDVVTEPLREARGLRLPGLEIPRRIKIGTWRRPGLRSFIVARRGQPAVRVRLRDHKYNQLLIGDAEAQGIAERLIDTLAQ